MYRTRSEPERALATLVLETDLLMRQLKAARTPDAQVDLRRLLLLAAETRTAILYSSGRFSDAIASAKQALACVEGDSATAAIQQRLVIRIAEMCTCAQARAPASRRGHARRYRHAALRRGLRDAVAHQASVR